MYPVDHQESTCKDGDEKVVSSSFSSSSSEATETEPEHLLDESWFFGNLLIHTKKPPKMSRCYSDPSPSSSVNYSTEDMMMSASPPQGKSLEETFSLLQKLPTAGSENSVGLIRAPSPPEESSSSSSLSSAAAGRGKRNQRRRHVLHRENSYSMTHPPPPLPVSSGNYNNLLSRAPSLPSSMGRRTEEIFQDDESDFSMSRLIRQASLKQSDTLPPRNPPIPKQQSVVQQGTTTMSKSRPRKAETEQSISIPENPMEGVIINRQLPVVTSRKKLTKSSSDVMFQMQGLSIKSEKTDALSGENTTISRSRLQKQQSMDTQNKKSVEDMKAQIKFWARAVASNVRQEC